MKLKENDPDMHMDACCGHQGHLGCDHACIIHCKEEVAKRLKKMAVDASEVQSASKATPQDAASLAAAVCVRAKELNVAVEIEECCGHQGNLGCTHGCIFDCRKQ